ncbi:hypothetical protein F5Y08DRAFT_294377 [Xylaria arbuscula]|nr:hypothetical protein F5Y08DRAFT_294377 [Xylaria arbuscula]
MTSAWEAYYLLALVILLRLERMVLEPIYMVAACLSHVYCRRYSSARSTIASQLSRMGVTRGCWGFVSRRFS